MPVNESATDRVVRVIIAVLLSLWAYQMTGAWAVVLWVLTAIAVLTGVTGRCLIYSLLHIKTAH